MKTIHISALLSEINKHGSVFSVGYRKDDGTYGSKEIVSLRNKNENGERKKMNRLGLLNLWEPRTGKFFDITIDLIVKFNNMRVIRTHTNNESTS